MSTYIQKYGHETEMIVETCILYDILNWKTVDKSYKTVCEMIGPDAISYVDFKNIFRQKMKENCDEDVIMRNLQNVVSKNRIAALSCILNDVIRRKSIQQSFKNLSEIIRKTGISPCDFDYWYYHFYHGNRDLAHDRSSSPKQITFSDISFDVINKIIDFTDMKSQINLAKVSHGLRSILAQRKPIIRHIELICEEFKVIVIFNHLEITYMNSAVVVIDMKEVIESALQDVLLPFKNPKLQLDIFKISFCSKLPISMESLSCTIKSTFEDLNRRIPIRKVSLGAQNENQVLSVLPYLKAGYLEEIELSGPIEFIWMEDFRNKEINKLQQYQLTKFIRIRYPQGFFLFERDTRSAFCEMRVDVMTIANLIRLREIFSKSITFKYCKIELFHSPSLPDIAHYLNLRQIVHENVPFAFQYSIPHTNDVLIYEFWLRGIIIRKEPRNSHVAYLI